VANTTITKTRNDMSRQKDFEKAAMDYCEDHSHCIYFEAGAEHGYQYAVDKMAEYLLSSLESELGYFATGDFVEGVMKFMEGL
jgi:hypothetical protein